MPTTKVNLYEVIFECTITRNNGKETRQKKSVLMRPFDANGRHVSPEQQIERGKKALHDAYLAYDIVYVRTKIKTVVYG